MIIRNATESDLDQILSIYKCARKYMIENGNPTQWKDQYPKENTIRNDIAQKESYVCVEDQKMIGVFTFKLGEDATYQTIEQGDWHDNRPYGTIHRVASNGQSKGIAKACFDFCKKKMDYIRIDTHADNKTMQAAIERNGFKRCGIIYVEDGSPRIAYDYRAPQSIQSRISSES